VHQRASEKPHVVSGAAILVMFLGVWRTRTCWDILSKVLDKLLLLAFSTTKKGGTEPGRTLGLRGNTFYL
jgi:hypothetical protein